MKKLRNHSQLKEQEKSPEAASNETDPCSLTDTEFKREIVKILKELRLNMKELRADVNNNADYFRKELEYRRPAPAARECTLFRRRWTDVGFCIRDSLFVPSFRALDCSNFIDISG